MVTCKHFIDGQFVEERDEAERITVFNPATEDKIADIPSASAEMVDRAVTAARRAQPAWAALPAVERAAHIKAITAIIRDKATMIAKVISREQGKILSVAQGEALGMAGFTDCMAEWARLIEGEIIGGLAPRTTFC